MSRCAPYPVRQRKRKPNNTKLRCSSLFSDVSLSTELFINAFQGTGCWLQLEVHRPVPRACHLKGGDRCSQTTLSPVMELPVSVCVLHPSLCLVRLTQNLTFFISVSEPYLRARSCCRRTKFILSASSLPSLPLHAKVLARCQLGGGNTTASA